MSFRKRNVVVSSAPLTARGSLGAQHSVKTELAAGLRPSPLDGRLTTSTGTQSLDAILAGHAGLPVGTSILVEEHGTTDFSGVLLKYYAAEGLVQGHDVHVLGYPSVWQHDLPAIASKEKGSSRTSSSSPSADEKMKIAWRYESLGPRSQPVAARGQDSSSDTPFCHAFDLTKRLSTASTKGILHATPAMSPPSLKPVPSTKSPFEVFIERLSEKLRSSPASSVHRVVVPSFLSPTLYAPGLCDPSQALPFLHSLRGLLRLYKDRLTILITLPVTLYPRSHGLVRWIELLVDGVLELQPLAPTSAAATDGKKDKEVSQGILKVHTLPVFHERGGGGAEGNQFREDLSFHLSGTQGLVIKPYTLPPMEDENHQEKSPASTIKEGIEF